MGFETPANDLDIVHRKGKGHVVPDMLSRSVPFIAEVTTADPWLVRMIRLIEKRPLSYPAWRAEGGNLYKFVMSRFASMNGDSPEWKKVIGRDGRNEILRQCHDNPLAGHMGVKKIFPRVSQKSYWPKMKSDIAKYVRACKTQTCQQVKPENSQLGV
ncbi:unnamed protein product [Ceratitis capitata]|uniref:(Mediterranean fruit fly) hypothetical protein n=1 Tax=Ceratitis capitata TaxID=7213 RepID=A0A811URD1_CERCA|nr:unnamed protein product [Ceratitis capitata]